jgi:hypothetical protein
LLDKDRHLVGVCASLPSLCQPEVFPGRVLIVCGCGGSEIMSDKEPDNTAPISVCHGGSDLPRVTVDTYNEELREGDGFVGDRASKRAFGHILEDWRERLRRVGDDPFGDKPTEEISKKKLDKVLAEGDPEPAGLIQGVIEEFANELAAVLRRFLKLKTWRDTERVVIGGGLRNSRVGELAIGRAAVLLKADGIDIDLSPIRHHPDEAGLIGAVHLVPSWIISGYEGILAVDIGGTNIRAGIVATALEKHPDLSKAAVAPTLRCHPRGCQRTARGRGGSLRHSSWRTCTPYSLPVSRRTQIKFKLTHRCRPGRQASSAHPLQVLGFYSILSTAIHEVPSCVNVWLGRDGFGCVHLTAAQESQPSYKRGYDAPSSVTGRTGCRGRIAGQCKCPSGRKLADVRPKPAAHV